MHKMLKNIFTSKVFLIPFACAIIFWILGSGIGIAAFGDAVSGSFVLTPIGAIIGFAYVCGFRITKKIKAQI